jgi:putative membrane protein
LAKPVSAVTVAAADPISRHWFGQPNGMNVPIKLLLGAAACAAALALPPAVANARGAYSPLDEEILRSSIQGDRFEIRGGRIAETHAASTRVQHLGARLVKDHTKSLREAVALAKRVGISVPSDPSTSEEWELGMVSSLSGHPFDVAYSRLEIQDHKQDIEEVHTELRGGSNADIRALERKDLPTLRYHLHLSKLAWWASS